MIFYNKLDKSRHTIGRLYHQEATLLWNGTQVKGKDDIVTFFEKLPTSETTLNMIDAQPVIDFPFLNGEQMIAATCGGQVKFDGKIIKNFSETFTLVSETNAEGKVWKIIMDTFRTC